MTSKPGLCRVIQYKYQLSSAKPMVGVRDQIRQIIENDIIEISDSPLINPLTVVCKEGKRVRLCLDARKINHVAIPDRESKPPIQELLQRFNGV
jgi:hypothetical protein